jgi:single-strand DNA-binding protein
MAQITVTGNVGTEPELKFFNGKNGDFAVTNFSLAYTPRERKGTEYVDGETIWFRISILGKQAELATEIKKGDKVLVVGAFKQSTYQGKDGATKTSLEIKADSFAIVPRAMERKKVEKVNDDGGFSSWT